MRLRIICSMLACLLFTSCSSKKDEEDAPKEIERTDIDQIGMARLLCLIFLLFSANGFAQTYYQTGVVRMITTSATSPTKPIKDVMVVVENNISDATDEAGRFHVEVTGQFQVSGIVQDKYILALPTRGKTYFYSENDLEVVVTTRVQRDADYQRLYAQIKAKYDAQSEELLKLKREYQRKSEELLESDADFFATQDMLFNLQRRYKEYVNNEDKIDAEIRRISEELSITDYQTLDSIERKIYDLKVAGEWKSLSDLLHEVMKGSAEAYLQEGLENQARAEESRKKPRWPILSPHFSSTQLYET